MAHLFQDILIGQVLLGTVAGEDIKLPKFKVLHTFFMALGTSNIIKP